MLEYLSHTVIRAARLGDWGSQFGMLIELALTASPIEQVRNRRHSRWSLPPGNRPPTRLRTRPRSRLTLMAILRGQLHYPLGYTTSLINVNPMSLATLADMR